MKILKSYFIKNNAAHDAGSPNSGSISDIIQNSQHTVNINRFYALAIAVSLAFLVFGLLLIQRTARFSKEETAGYIQDAIEQTTFAVDEHIREEFDTLMAAAVVAQDRDLLADDQVLHALLTGLGSHNGYVLIGFADTTGEAVWVDEDGREHRDDLFGEGFIRRALEGENSLSQKRYYEKLDMYIHYYSVPVYDGKTDRIEGTMFAAEPQDDLRNIVNHSLYAGKGLAHIINQQGDYMVRSYSPLVVGVGDSIFELRTPLDDALEASIRADLASGKANYIERSFYGEDRLIAYAPMDINDWFVFYAVPEEMVNAGLKTVTVGTIITVCIATAIFVFLLLLIRKLNEKNRTALEHLAFIDPVTGHGNFNRFLLDANQTLRSADGENYAVCYCDIKDFRYINDVFGREVGDRMLRYLADFLHRISQDGEAFARIDEDSFVSLRKYKSKREIELRFEGAAQQLAIFPESFSHGYKAELYGGAYLIDPADGDLSLNDMLDRAITAQEETQLTGGIKRLGIYSKEMREQALWKTEVESKMEAALENNEFTVYLQPKIDIQNGNCIQGAEALVRWASPENGMLLPARFIDIFEKNGFIIDLDMFVFDRVCRYYQETVLKNKLPACILSVNVSRLWLMRPDFIRSYTEIRQSYGIPAGCIELEFTESLAVGDSALFKATVSECKRNGFLCSMDDFGAGYSSLNMLKSIDMVVLKLDRQFFLYGDDAQRGQELVKNMIAMAKDLKMKTVAEGIDDESLVEQLRAMGCDAVQGFVFAKPMPMDEFTKFADSWCRG